MRDTWMQKAADLTEVPAGQFESNGFKPLAADAPVQVGAAAAPHKEAAPPSHPRVIDIDGDQDSIAQETLYAPDGVHVPGAEPMKSAGEDLFQPVGKAADAEKATIDEAQKKGWSPSTV